MKIITSLALAFTALFLGCAESPVEPTTEMSTEAAHADTVSTVGELPAVPRSEEPRSEEPRDIEFGDKFPEVLAAKASPNGNGDWNFSVTLSSAYDTPERYADAWRVLDSQGNLLGIRILGHDHANEQPFTRSGNIHLPEDIDAVFVEGRDQLNGWSGQRFKMFVPSR